MLPQSYRDRYQKFQLALEQMQQIQSSASAVSTLEGDPASAAVSNYAARLKEAFTQVEEIFGRQILTPGGDDLDPTIAARLQSYLTEINKQLHLLRVDVMFLQASRQPATAQARIAQINSRLQTSIAYCQAILQIE